MSTDKSTRARWQILLETIATLAFIVVSATLVWAMLSDRQPIGGATAPTSARARRVAPALPVEPIQIADAAFRGSKTAKVALIAYSDFQCPFCGKFAREILPSLEAKYVTSGKVLVAFKQLPLTNHQFAQKAAEASECAGQQGKFWPMHDEMFGNQRQLDEPSLRQAALKLGLDSKRFDLCLDGETSARVQRDAAEAKALNISGTPAFLVGLIQPDGRVKVVKRLTGAQPVAQFEATLDPILSAGAESANK